MNLKVNGLVNKEKITKRKNLSWSDEDKMRQKKRKVSHRRLMATRQYFSKADF